MAEEMMFESLPWESDEAYDGEADEAYDGEAEDSAEDLGESARRRQQARRRRYYQPRYQPAPVQGVGGIRVRGQDGRARQVAFPAKLATAAETNRGLATQEIGRRALEERLDRLETRSRAQLKNSNAVSGVVSLAIGAPLAAWGLIRPTQTGGSRLSNWANEDTTRMASLASASQLATTGARVLINKSYPGGVSMAADLFAAAQLAAFAFGSMNAPAAIDEVQDAKAPNAAAPFPIGARVFDLESKKIFEVTGTKSGAKFFV